MIASDLCAWLLLLTFERVRYVEGEGWQIRPAVADDSTPWAVLGDVETWFRRVASDALPDDEDGRRVRAALHDPDCLAAALNLLHRESFVFVPAPERQSPAGPRGVLVDLADARRRRLARAS